MVLETIVFRYHFDTLRPRGIRWGFGVCGLDRWLSFNHGGMPASSAVEAADIQAYLRLAALPTRAQPSSTIGTEMGDMFLVHGKALVDSSRSSRRHVICIREARDCRLKEKRH